MERNIKEKQLQPCTYCKQGFKQLSKHAPHCKKRPEIEEVEKVFVKLGIEKDHEYHHPSGQTFPAKESQDPDGVKVKEKPREICIGCGNKFINLKKHKPYCKSFYSKTTDSESSPSAERSLESSKAKVSISSLEQTPQRKLMDSASSTEKCKTACPYCGTGYIQLQKHVRACKKNPSYSSDPISIGTNDLHSGSSDLTQQKHNRSKGSERKGNVLERIDSVDFSSSTVDEENAEGTHKNQTDHWDTAFLKSRKTLLTPISINTASLVEIAFSEDPKAELDRLQSGNIIDEVEISKAEEVVKEIESLFLRKLNENSCYKWTIFRTGSYSDETKIKSANEFDFIVSLGIKCSVKFLENPSTLGYCLVVPILELNVPQEISSLMTGVYLDPILVKEMAFKLFEKVILDVDFHKGRPPKRLHRDGGSPAFTIGYSAGGGKEYDIDLVPAIHLDGWPPIVAINNWQPKWRHRHSLQELKKDYFAVARENPNAKTLHQGMLLWRLSFSRTEKMLWLSADSSGSMRTCRKHILKILKGILEDCKYNNGAMMPNLSSFHLRTFMLHQCDQRPDDNDWLETKRRQCLHVCIGELVHILTSRQMSNYYVRGHNVLQNLEDEEIRIFTEALIKASATF
ncbi:hypothetical protein CHS0354_020279 [Potamilus streckersoni]|uniref:Uncharacterized protein n=1 Tax=Potamilus streckersoni TaxID=2493646 RepID=A0AAE0S5C9_9BIVA|nr:hypothetical protein CHS0354_020279 [Potamilus streckersoni]